jgi:serine/threonine protein phosphatase PrpC
MQDRHLYIPDLKPHGSIAQQAGAAERLGLAAVFDGHKRCEAANLAHKLLPELLSRRVTPLKRQTCRGRPSLGTF